ncbi:hypothetical protein CC86DRAFT_467678 [Ophiobolus disseminans]|uniref:Uncharacterized protein n=1 Tax=Ophiobolus disseminans TaxID=1469910 RepID=A0A6A6ZXM9_9PLEO|nr:hypothetical protein CC86DRAFT_467678 [Ophiobolus disseminans]
MLVIYSFFKERSVADKSVAVAKDNYALACEVYVVALRASYCGPPELQLAMQRVHQSEKNIATAQKYGIAVDDKIDDIITKINQGMCCRLTARVMEVLPPELRDAVYKNLCNTRKVLAIHFRYRSSMIKLTRLPILNAEVAKVSGALASGDSTTNTTPVDVIYLWFDSSFAEQFIEFWYRKTEINVIMQKDLDQSGFLCHDFWGTQLVLSLSMVQILLTVTNRTHGNPDFAAVDLPKVLTALDGNLHSGANIVIVASRKFKSMTGADRAIAFRKLMDAAITRPPTPHGS